MFWWKSFDSFVSWYEEQMWDSKEDYDAVVKVEVVTQYSLSQTTFHDWEDQAKQHTATVSLFPALTGFLCFVFKHDSEKDVCLEE